MPSSFDDVICSHNRRNNGQEVVTWNPVPSRVGQFGISMERTLAFQDVDLDTFSNVGHSY